MNLDQALVEQTGYSLNQYLQPLECAEPKSADAIYQIHHQIKLARRADDASTPAGEWAHELKKPDWRQVINIGALSLAQEVKDLQLVAWLVEAQVQDNGFSGIAPGLWMAAGLCSEFWEELLPLNDVEHRNNILEWMNNQLPKVVAAVPLVSSEVSFTWEDVQRATLKQQYLAANDSHDSDDELSLKDCEQLIKSIETSFLLETQIHLSRALEVCDAFNNTIAQCVEDDPPSLFRLEKLIGEILDVVSYNLNLRGVSIPNNHGEVVVEAEPHVVGKESESEAVSLATDEGLVPTRFDAYAQIRDIAEFLIEVEPHSPVPYMLRRMVEWGDMSTSELYQQLFVNGSGRIDVFEVLGIERDATS